MCLSVALSSFLRKPKVDFFSAILGPTNARLRCWLQQKFAGKTTRSQHAKTHWLLGWVNHRDFHHQFGEVYFCHFFPTIPTTFLSQSNFRVHWFWEFRNLNFWGCCPWSHLQRCIDLYPKRVLLHSKDDDVVWLFKGFYHCIIFILCGYQWQYVWYSV